jgi:hypothetical protein
MHVAEMRRVLKILAFKLDFTWIGNFIRGHAGANVIKQYCSKLPL